MSAGLPEAAAIFGLVTGSIGLIRLTHDIICGARGRAPAWAEVMIAQLPNVQALLENAQNTKGKHDPMWKQVHDSVAKTESSCKALHAFIERVCLGFGDESSKRDRAWITTEAIIKGHRKDAQSHLTAIYQSLDVLQKHLIITNTKILDDLKRALDQWKDESSDEDGYHAAHYQHNNRSSVVQIAQSGDHGRISHDNEFVSLAISTRDPLPSMNEDSTYHDLLQWLFYHEMDDGRAMISEAHKSTFRWVFESHSPAKIAETASGQGAIERPGEIPGHNTGFVPWLRTQGGLYWIHGKHGAGKSTLMKYLADDKRLLEHGTVWAASASRELVVASFYFYKSKSSSTLQQSLCGLYRALLWQIIKQDSDLAKCAFPQWNSREGSTEPRLPDLARALRYLANANNATKTFLFLIDGLDEYEYEDAHNKLIKDLLQLVEKGFIKLIIASRPGPVFVLHFSDHPNLPLHELTAHDIRHYVEDELIKNKAIRPVGEELSELDTTLLHRFAEAVAMRADGLFLRARAAVAFSVAQIQKQVPLESLLEDLFTPDSDLERQILTINTGHESKRDQYDVSSSTDMRSQTIGPVPSLTHASTQQSSQNPLGFALQEFGDDYSVRTDKRDHNVNVDAGQNYSDIFVSQLIEGLDEVLHSKNSDYHARQRMGEALPTLIKAFTLMLDRRARSGFESKAVIFIRHRRNPIARAFQEDVVAMPSNAGVPDLRIRLGLWLEDSSLGMTMPEHVDDQHEIPDDQLEILEDQQETVDEVLRVNDHSLKNAEEMAERSSELMEPAQIRQARAFMIESGNDFPWLLQQVKTAANLKTTGATEDMTRDALIAMIGMNSAFELDLGWDPVNFFAEQYESYSETGCRLQDVICLCGEGDDVEATSCQQYVNKVWPDIGSEILDFVSGAVYAGEGAHAITIHETIEIEIEVVQSRTLVRLKADFHTLVECSTFFVWLSTAIRAAPQDYVVYCMPEIQLSGETTCRVTHRHDQLPSKPQSHVNCWHRMFRNPVVARGYPVSPRSAGEKGLEIPFGMMAAQARTPYLTWFEGATFLKGFSTILSLVRQAGKTFTWHFLINQDRKRMSYNKGLDATELRQEVEESELQAGRHFVGWSPCVDMLAGTADANYDIGKSGKFSEKPPIASVSSAALGISKIASAGITFAPGYKDITPASAGLQIAEELLVATKDWTVLFYDITTRQAWLLDCPSALLHICRAWLSSENATMLCKDAPVDPISVFQHAQLEGTLEEAVDLLLSPMNRSIELRRVDEKPTIDSSDGLHTRKMTVEKKTKASWWTWGDLVDARVLKLESLHDRLYQRRASRNSNIQNPAKGQALEGHDFSEIMVCVSQPRTWTQFFHSGGWPDFTNSIDAIPIFGSNFGDLLRPTVSGTIGLEACGQKTSLPQGDDYLAVPLYIIQRLCAEQLKPKGKGANCLSHIQLGDATYWLDPRSAFAPCNCPHTACQIFVARLASSARNGKVHSEPLHALFSQNPRGAVIFPCRSNRLRKSQTDAGNQDARFSDTGSDRLRQHFHEPSLGSDHRSGRNSPLLLDLPVRNSSTRERRNASNRFSDADMLLVPPALRAPPPDSDNADETAIADNSYAGQHSGYDGTGTDRERNGYLTVAGPSSSAGSTPQHEDNVVLQPRRLRKVTASRSLREQSG